MLTLAEIPSFQKFFITAQTAKMADFMFQNMAYRATVYRTGGWAQVKKKIKCVKSWSNQKASMMQVLPLI